MLATGVVDCAWATQAAVRNIVLSRRRFIGLPGFSRVSKQQRRELVEASTPALPFVRRAWRLVINVVDVRFGEEFVQIARSGEVLGGSHAEKHHADLSC